MARRGGRRCQAPLPLQRGCQRSRGPCSPGAASGDPLLPGARGSEVARSTEKAWDSSPALGQAAGLCRAGRRWLARAVLSMPDRAGASCGGGGMLPRCQLAFRGIWGPPPVCGAPALTWRHTQGSRGHRGSRWQTATSQLLLLQLQPDSAPWVTRRASRGSRCGAAWAGWAPTSPPPPVPWPHWRERCPVCSGQSRSTDLGPGRYFLSWASRQSSASVSQPPRLSRRPAGRREQDQPPGGLQGHRRGLHRAMLVDTVLRAWIQRVGQDAGGRGAASSWSASFLSWHQRRTFPALPSEQLGGFGPFGCAAIPTSPLQHLCNRVPCPRAVTPAPSLQPLATPHPLLISGCACLDISCGGCRTLWPSCPLLAPSAVFSELTLLSWGVRAPPFLAEGHSTGRSGPACWWMNVWALGCWTL